MSNVGVTVTPNSARLFWSSASFLILIKTVLLKGMGVMVLSTFLWKIALPVKSNFVSLSHIEVSPGKAINLDLSTVKGYKDGNLPVIFIALFVSVPKSCTPTGRWKPPALLLWASQGVCLETSVRGIRTYGKTILLIKGQEISTILYGGHMEKQFKFVCSFRQPHRNLMPPF